MEPYLGQIMAVGFNFAPRGWALCQGQLLPIAQNTSLFSLLGTMYGGDGRTTFALPDLQGRMIIGKSSTHPQGAKSGSETVTLTVMQMPSHQHAVALTDVSATMNVLNGPPSDKLPAGNILATAKADLYSSSAPDSTLNEDAIAITGAVTCQDAGGSQPFSNMPPYQVVNYCIALVGVYPSRG